MHIVEVARAMLNEKKMHYYFWAEAIANVVYIMNMTPTTTIHGMMLEEKYAGRKPNISHSKVFGYIAYLHVLDERRNKSDPKAKKCIFIG